MNNPEAEYQAELARRQAAVERLDKWLARAAVDEKNWRCVAKRVLAGDYANSTASEKRVIWRGVSAYQFPECQQAAEALKGAL